MINLKPRGIKQNINFEHLKFRHRKTNSLLEEAKATSVFQETPSTLNLKPYKPFARNRQPPKPPQSLWLQTTGVGELPHLHVLGLSVAIMTLENPKIHRASKATSRKVSEYQWLHRLRSYEARQQLCAVALQMSRWLVRRTLEFATI